MSITEKGYSDPEPSEYYLARANSRPAPRMDIPTRVITNVSKLAIDADIQAAPRLVTEMPIKKEIAQEIATLPVDERYL